MRGFNHPIEKYNRIRDAEARQESEQRARSLKVYRLIRQRRARNPVTNEASFVPEIIATFKAKDYDEALSFAARIEIMPGVFGDDPIEPNGDMFLLEEVSK